MNGSFDLLHAGHIFMISQAKKQGDILIMALNSDESIKGYKGKDRPIVTLQHRLELIAALESVDFVTYFDELDPCKLLQKIAPDIHVNGSEYGEDCIEAKVVKQQGGQVYIVNKIEGLSTSAIIEKIKCVT